MPSWAGIIALVEPMMLVGFVVWGYLSIKRALKRAQIDLSERIVRAQRRDTTDLDPTKEA